MKAAIVKIPEAVPEYGEFVDPTLEEGLELVDLVAAGLHPIVRSLADGRHYGSTRAWPLIPGVDAVARTVAGALIFTGFVQPPYRDIRAAHGRTKRNAVRAAVRGRCGEDRGGDEPRAFVVVTVAGASCARRGRHRAYPRRNRHGGIARSPTCSTARRIRGCGSWAKSGRACTCCRARRKDRRTQRRP